MEMGGYLVSLSIIVSESDFVNVQARCTGCWYYLSFSVVGWLHIVTRKKVTWLILWKVFTARC